ncbi:pre-mRNA 3'-end-processing factor FIP1 isoform X1 [Salmo salar]|uniref:Pre-mRNA 3'-end-processing factor FIP1 isoform X1 n=1 Tax=Salmo salar TaxID=8030 RepID=A0A1S3L1H8_SALSA|nr:pre-mRNA 3'-end-processing factor FIP1 isoform X1 [Salmo salar]|eukprot:XP_013984816.1 PREDICTED: pre-mRNA 3'-end-processing factor FIP1-like isoform X1 [Salmo salar]
MATELTISESAVPLSEPHQVEDEEHWLYGGENTNKQNAPEGLPGPGDSLQLTSMGNTEEKDAASQEAKGTEGEEEEDSDSDDDDDVKVTIGNIKTGAPSYMGTGMNLSLKPARGYASAAIKLQSKGIDIETLGAFNGAPVVEVEMDIFEDKPWRKPGADLSDYFNYGFNEETWKGYCERQRRLQLGLEPSAPLSFENKITVQQGRATTLEKDTEPSSIKPDYKPDFLPASVLALAANRLKAGPPPNRKLGGTIDVIGGQTGAIRRVEGRRREMQEQNPIQVLGDHGNKVQPLVPPSGPPPPLPLPMGMPPPHFLHPPPPVSGMPPPLHPPGIPPPSITGLFPPPLAPPPTLMMPPVDSSRAPLPFGYNSGESSFISYPPVSSSHMPWGSVLEKGGEDRGRGHWEYQGSHRERDRERDQERDHTPTTSEYNEDDRYHYYSHDRESEREFEHSYLHVHDSSGGRSREREEHQRDRRHRDKEESGKHKSSKRKQHDDEGEGHRRHKHKKSKRSKEDKDVPEDMVGRGEEHKD